MDFYPVKARRLADAVLRGEGHTAPELRQTIASRAASHAGGRPPAAKLPAELADYVDTVAGRAYETRDDQFMALREAGLSEEEIFEITLSVALGSGLERLERGLAVLEEASLDQMRSEETVSKEER